MKKLRLKRWVKVVLVVALVVLLAKCNYEINKKAISDCVQGGNSMHFCEHHLGN